MLQLSGLCFLNLFSSSEFFWEFFLVFLEGLGWLRGISMGVCEALCDIACKKGYPNKFLFDLHVTYFKDVVDNVEKHFLSYLPKRGSQVAEW